MATAATAPATASALAALFLGLFYLASGLGALGRPGHWERMIEEIEASPFMQMISGAFAILIGALLVMAVAPHRDWLGTLVFAFGCIAAFEGVVLLALPGQLMRFSRVIVSGGSRLAAVLTLALGAVLCVAAFMRF